MENRLNSLRQADPNFYFWKELMKLVQKKRKETNFLCILFFFSANFYKNSVCKFIQLHMFRSIPIFKLILEMFVHYIAFFLCQTVHSL